MAEEINGNPLPEDQKPPSENNSQESNIPDWMREAGWEDDTGSFDESKPVFDDMEGEDPIVPAEIPAWLEEAAPEGFSLDSDPSSAIDGSLESNNVQALMDDDFISSTPENADLIEPPGTKSDKEQVKPDPIEDPELDVPSWLENLELDEDSQETAVAWLENMPESLRATDEELEQAKIKEQERIRLSELKNLGDAEDELAWIDEASKTETEPPVQAELSEDLVSADLLPEKPTEEKLFATEELRSLSSSDSPDWLDELGNEDSVPVSSPEDKDLTQESEKINDLPGSSISDQSEPDEDVNLLPDWLSELDDEEVSPASESVSSTSTEGEAKIEAVPEEPTTSEEIPDWLGDFESTQPVDELEGDSSNLAWLESLAENQGVPEEQLISTPEEREEASPPTDESVKIETEDVLDDLLKEITPLPEDEPVKMDLPSAEQAVSPNDDTLNTEIPDWLTAVGENEESQDVVEPKTKETESKFEESASWLEQLEEQPTGELQQEDPAHDSEVMDWLEGRNDQSSDREQVEDLADDLRESLTAELNEPQTHGELETAKDMPQDAETESMPDWLSELDDTNKDESSLENALRQSAHTLSDEEQNFLDQNEEAQGENADWLAKLDLEDEQQPTNGDTPAIKVEISEEIPVEEAVEETSISGGILDRLKDTGAIKLEPEVPQWLENLKKEEDPQETAILWLKQFVEQGDQATITDQIKRYTDELNTGDMVPAWMEDLKNEEDPQTTAMLWLEKLSGDRPETDQEPPKQTQPEEADWLSALDKEEADQTNLTTEQPTENFQDDSNGWLADLDIDGKSKTTEEELSDWVEDPEEEQADTQDGEPPLWMKATSPLEGDFHTDELPGEDKEVEIPEWLAGYGEGEGPEDKLDPTDSTTVDPEEYTWVSAGDESPKPSKEPIDLNSAAISQLEGILGISYQVARGIIRYREQNGPYQELKDLLNVPEITDEQTIEILKPEVVIHGLKTEPKSTKPKAPPAKQTPGERLEKARALMADRNIPDSISEYDFLIKKKKSINDVIADLVQATENFPNDVSIIKTLGDAYMKVNNLEAALESYSKAEDLLR